MKLYAHPFSSYCWKALIAFHENAIPFEYRMLDDPGAMDKLTALWPLKWFPVLVDGGRTVVASFAEARPSRANFPLGAPDRG